MKDAKGSERLYLISGQGRLSGTWGKCYQVKGRAGVGRSELSVLERELTPLKGMGQREEAQYSGSGELDRGCNGRSSKS